MPSDLRTRAIVLRRTNYGESDRILNLLTPEGKVSVLARGVRKEKSRLAGSIELFTVTDVVVHQGRGKLATLTSARMLQFYQHIIDDITKLELAATFLKKLDRAAEQFSNPEHFSLLTQALAGLDRGIPSELVLTWFLLNLARTGGEELNLVRDTAGADLRPDCRYVWDAGENALRPDLSGRVGASEIKLARFLLTNPLAHATRVNQIERALPPVLSLAQTMI